MDRVDISKRPERIAGMFDAIAGRYDTLNHLLSGGVDRLWRRRAIRALGLTGRERLLDMCTGTGDLAIAAATSRRGGAREVIGLDFAGEMLRLGLAKVRARGLEDRVRFARADAMRVPLADGSCDAAAVAFGIRNVADPSTACREFYRVLAPGGRLAVLEFGKPSSRIVRAGYEWYSRVVLPGIGRLISGHAEAYSYLPASVEAFPFGDRFADVLRGAGFSEVRYVQLTLGVVYLYVARRD